MADEEYESCIAHIKDIVEELESSNFTNIREILGMTPNLEVEHARHNGGFGGLNQTGGGHAE